MCVVTLAKLRLEPPDKLSSLLEQIRKSKQQKELSVDILDYMCDSAIDLEMNVVQTAYGVKEIKEIVEDFRGISLDSL